MRFETFNAPEKQEAIEKCRENKSLYWDELMKQYGAYIRTLSRYFGRKYGIDEDIEQESLMKMFSKFEDYRGTTPTKFKAWIRSVISNTASNSIKQHIRLITVGDNIALIEGNRSSIAPEDVVLSKITVEAVDDVAQKSSVLEQDIYGGLKNDGAPADEARRLGKTRENYESRKSKMCAKFREAMKGWWD